MAATLKEILSQVAVEEVKGPTTTIVDGIIFDSRKAADGLLFVAVKGTQADGHAYIADVVKKGVKAVVCEALPAQLESDVTYVRVKDTTEALGRMADAFYGFPSRELKTLSARITMLCSEVAPCAQRRAASDAFPARIWPRIFSRNPSSFPCPFLRKKMILSAMTAMFMTENAVRVSSVRMSPASARNVTKLLDIGVSPVVTE